jgi:hypothetical protein
MAVSLKTTRTKSLVPRDRARAGACVGPGPSGPGFSLIFQLAGLIMLLCSSIAGCAVALAGPLRVWARMGDSVVLVLMPVLLVVGALVICAGIVGSWLPEVRLRKRRGDSADLE